MVLYIRNKKNDTIVDIECYVKTEDDHKFVELGSTVCIEPYSKFLLESPKEKHAEIMRVFDFLQELRGWLWEGYFCGRKNNHEEYDEVIEQLRTIVKGAAGKYDLCYVED